MPLSDSWGLSLQAGADCQINDRWLLSAAVWKLDISTDAEVDTANLGREEVDVDTDPWVYMIGVGYRFYRRSRSPRSRRWYYPPFRVFIRHAAL